MIASQARGQFARKFMTFQSLDAYINGWMIGREWRE